MPTCRELLKRLLSLPAGGGLSVVAERAIAHDDVVVIHADHKLSVEDVQAITRSVCGALPLGRTVLVMDRGLRLTVARRIEHDDVVTIDSDRKLSLTEVERIRRYVQCALPNARVIVIDRGLTFAVERPPPAPRNTAIKKGVG